MKTTVEKHIKRLLLTALMLVMLVTPVLAEGGIEDLELTGTAIILIERNTGRVLYERNADQQIYPASMIKIMTATLLLEYFEPEEIIQVGREVNEVPFGSSVAGHNVGEHVSVHNLVRGLMLPSGNDTANVVAMNVARRVSGNDDLTFAEAEKIFVGLMNDKARELGANSTHFTNAHGFHDDDLYTTVRDLSLIIKNATEIPIIKSVGAEVEFIGPSAVGVGLQTRDIHWRNSNRLLDGEFYNPDVTGLKTGYHTPAGWCLAATGTRNGVEVISIIADSLSVERWGDTTAMYDYVFDNFRIETIHTGADTISEIEIANPRWGDDPLLKTIGTKDFSYLFNADELSRIQRTVYWNEDVSFVDDNDNLFFVAPFLRGDILGEVVYTLDDQEIFRDNIIITNDVEEWSYGASLVFVINFLRANPFSIYGLSFILGLIFLSMAVYKVTSLVIYFSIRKTKNRAYSQKPKMKRRY